LNFHGKGFTRIFPFLIVSNLNLLPSW
jgi:hypothetical protein